MTDHLDTYRCIKRITIKFLMRVQVVVAKITKIHCKNKGFVQIIIQKNLFMTDYQKAKLTGS